MKILFVNNGLAGGGVEKLLNDMLPLINESGNYCELLILFDDDAKYLESLRNNGVKVQIVPKKIYNKGHFQRILYIMNYIKNNNFDIVHANEFPLIYYCSIIKTILGKKMPKLVMTEHNTDNRRRHIKLSRPLEKLIYRNYDKVTSISDKVQEVLLDWLRPNDRDKYVVVYNGIAAENFRNSKPYERSDLLPEISEKDKLLCVIGSLTEQKNYFFMLEVMESLPDNYHVLCLGEGPLKQKIISKIQQKGLQKRVHLLGFRKDAARILKTVDVLVIPSLWEGFGLIAVEALASQTPVVVSNVPGLAEVVGDAGIKCSVNNVDEFTRAIKKVTNDNEYARQLAKLGKKQVNKYDVRKMTKDYLKLYKQLLE
ncbi:glycosyltransferase [Ligilactobacillus salivarius]|uniref:glycosyltransferase family 1 protein n=1 Tax=Ligilactobacillus salivarius TaxID=1624 RepID=UPI000E502007|nr:glycosyltransferase family 1 protein [Ligilactobacillus salivarius]MCR4913789.1 glycosyltransferase family 1 protein [Lactobacillus sp.]RHJ59869.1 glycosyltransferase [Ligilactobacillus salivarius]